MSCGDLRATCKKNHRFGAEKWWCLLCYGINHLSQQLLFQGPVLSFKAFPEGQESGVDLASHCKMFPRAGAMKEKALLDPTSCNSLADGVCNWPLLPA